MKRFDKNLEQELISWRRYLHQHPESAFEEVNTSNFIAEKLESFGYEVTKTIGKTGLIGLMKLGDSDKVIALRSDIDCINVQEQNDFSYKSKIDGKMHACGHDGHMATMLGSAKLLSIRKNFNGTIIFVFQPAEEPGYGAKAMIEDGLIKKFNIQEIYGFHNKPDLKEGTFYSRVGGIMASEDNFTIKIHGRGGHASTPQITIDPLVIASEIISSLQTIVSRNISPIDTAVVSCTEIITDGAHNVIPSNVTIMGDTRSFNKDVSSTIEKRMKEITENICKVHGAKYEFSYTHEFYPTINNKDCYETAISAAKNVLGKENVVENCEPWMGSEDFAMYLNEIPGCFSFLGGKKSENDEVYSLHNHNYDYNDDNLIKGAEIFAEIIRIRLN